VPYISPNEFDALDIINDICLYMAIQVFFMIAVNLDWYALTYQRLGGEFQEDGYVARTVGDKVTKDMMKQYIRYHK